MAGDGAWPGPREYRGDAGLAAFREDWFGIWDEPTVWRARTEHLPGDRTLIEAHASGKVQGAAFELRLCRSSTSATGRWRAFEHFFDEAAARAAAGAA